MAGIVVRGEALIACPPRMVQAQFADMAHHASTPAQAWADKP